MSIASRAVRAVRLAVGRWVPRFLPPPAERVWLTFDDGPHETVTPQVLDVLKAEQVRATFFVVGEAVERCGAEILRRAAAEGHAIGLHGWRHEELVGRDSDEVRAGLGRTQDLVSKLVCSANVFRPPFGESTPEIDAFAAELGCRKVLWDVDPRDWDPAFQPDGWIDSAISQLRRLRTARVLLHDVHPTTSAGLARFIRQVRRLGRTVFQPPETL